MPIRQTWHLGRNLWRVLVYSEHNSLLGRDNVSERCAFLLLLVTFGSYVDVGSYQSRVQYGEMEWRRRPGYGGTTVGPCNTNGYVTRYANRRRVSMHLRFFSWSTELCETGR